MNSKDFMEDVDNQCALCKEVLIQKEGLYGFDLSIEYKDAYVARLLRKEING